MKKSFSIFLILIVALSSVGMSVSQHLCSMSKEEIEQSACDMCASEDRRETETAASDENSCCSEESIHLRVDTDATSTKTPEAPQPHFTANRVELLPLAQTTAELIDFALTADRSILSFPAAEKHTVLQV